MRSEEVYKDGVRVKLRRLVTTLGASEVRHVETKTASSVEKPASTVISPPTQAH